MKTTPSIKPKHATVSDGSQEKSNRIMHFGMMACCAVMFIPIVLFFAAGGTIAGAWQSAGLFIPILACVGMHLVLHKVMGKSCHGEEESDGSEPAKQAVLSRNNQMKARTQRS